MIKLRNTLIAVIAITSLSMLSVTSSFAGTLGIGVAGSVANIAASGTESDRDGGADTSGRTATASNNAYIGSLFLEYNFNNGMTFGVDYIPGKADVSSSKLTRLDVAGLANRDDTDHNKTRTAQASIEKHLTYYAEVPLGGAGFYVKGGFTTMDINTNETPAKYGSTDTDGLMFGAGFKQEMTSNTFYKLEGTHTEFDTITLTGTGHTAGSAAANQIKADLDVTKLTFGLGYSF